MIQMKKGKMQAVWSEVLQEEIEKAFLNVNFINIIYLLIF